MSDEEFLERQITALLKRPPTVADRYPSLAYLGVALMVVSYLADLFFIGAWILRVLEIHSVFDRLLTGWSALEYLGAAMLSSLATYLLTKTLGRWTIGKKEVS